MRIDIIYDAVLGCKPFRETYHSPPKYTYNISCVVCDSLSLPERYEKLGRWPRDKPAMGIKSIPNSVETDETDESLVDRAHARHTI